MAVFFRGTLLLVRVVRELKSLLKNENQLMQHMAKVWLEFNSQKEFILNQLNSD